MSRGNGLYGRYDRLTPEERFKLDVLATARGDTEESERLTRTCPRHSYTMNDRAFAGRWAGATELTLRVYIPLGEELTRLQVVDAFRELVPYSRALSRNIALDAYFAGHESGSRQAREGAGRTGSPPAWSEDGPDGEATEPDERDDETERELAELEAGAEECVGLLAEVLDRLEIACASQALSIWSGYAAFCEESVGVAAEKVGAAILSPVMARIEEMKARAGRLGAEADPGIVEEIRAYLAEAWRDAEGGWA